MSKSDKHTALVCSTNPLAKVDADQLALAFVLQLEKERVELGKLQLQQNQQHHTETLEQRERQFKEVLHMITAHTRFNPPLIRPWRKNAIACG